MRQLGAAHQAAIDRIAQRTGAENDRKAWSVPLDGPTPDYNPPKSRGQKDDDKLYRTDIPGIDKLARREADASMDLATHFGGTVLSGAAVPPALYAGGKLAGKIFRGITGSGMGPSILLDSMSDHPVLPAIAGGIALSPFAPAYFLGQNAVHQGQKMFDDLDRMHFENRRLAPFLRSAKELPYTSDLESPGGDPGYLPKK
jgi:hypothetical protein